MFIAVYTAMVGLTVRGTFHHVKVIEQVKHMIYNIWLHNNYSHDSWFHNKYTDHIYTTGLVDYLKHGNNLIGTTMVFKIRIQKSITDPKVLWENFWQIPQKLCGNIHSTIHCTLSTILEKRQGKWLLPMVKCWATSFKTNMALHFIGFISIPSIGLQTSHSEVLWHF